LVFVIGLKIPRLLEIEPSHLKREGGNRVLRIALILLTIGNIQPSEPSLVIRRHDICFSDPILLKWHKEATFLYQDQKLAHEGEIFHMYYLLIIPQLLQGLQRGSPSGEPSKQ
jgi:hypothetical protein